MQRMIIHESIEIIDKNIVFFVFFLFFLLILSQHIFLHNIVLIHKLNIFPYFHNQCRWIFFFLILRMSLVFTGNFMSLKSSLFAKGWSVFVILLGLWSPGFKYLAKHYLKRSLPSVVFWALINLFHGWSNFFGNLI